MRARIILILSSALLLLGGFQNCGKSGNSAPSGPASGSASESVIGTTSAYKKIVYDPALELSVSLPNTHLEVDVDAGTLSLALASATLQCTVDAVRLAALKELLATSKVCVPGPLPEGSVSCMAISGADVELTDGVSSVQLRRIVCNSGIFLCDGNDEKLRDILADFRANPPASCTIN